MSLDEIRNTKLEKIDRLRKTGIDPYPASSKRSHNIEYVLSGFETLSSEKTLITLTGRIMARREHGGSAFFDLRDQNHKIQSFIKEDLIGQDKFKIFKELIDIGDFIEVTGTLFTTKKNEKTLEVSDFKLLTKSVLPLPEKWHGIQDEDERLRKRYLDLIMNPGERELFIKKSRFWQSVRHFLINEGGLEVETPVLEKIPGGADAEPFATHMNALDINLYLRISPELNLKRLLVSGYEKVFEIGRIFRNEGMDREHLQDYTQVEMYWAYTDYQELMVITQKMLTKVIHETLGQMNHEYQGQKINWGQDWKTYDYYSEFTKYTNINLASATEKNLSAYALEENIDTSKHIGKGRLIDIIFKKKVRPNLIEPGFLILPPVDIEPLAKRWSEDLNRVERFQIVAGGTELGKGFSELNDPADQRARFEEQAKLGEAGDKEAQRMDEDFVEALEYGMPPAAGFAISERFFAFLMNKPIRETVFFPLMRPKEQ